MINSTQLPFINLLGAKGAGKDTIHEAIIRLFLPRHLRHLSKEELIERYHHHPPRMKLVKRATERKRRRGEEGNWKSPGSWVLQFFESEEFERRLTNGRYGPDVIFDDRGEEPIFSNKSGIYGDYAPDILPLSLRWVSDNGVPARSGVLHPRHYPEPDEDTLFYLGILADSTQLVTLLMMEYFPNMKSFFLSVEEEEIKQRLCVRNKALGLTVKDHLEINKRYLASHPEDGCIVVSNDGGITPEQCAIKIAKIAGLPLPARVLR